jgi:hypothetical protein
MDGQDSKGAASPSTGAGEIGARAMKWIERLIKDKDRTEARATLRRVADRARRLHVTCERALYEQVRDELLTRVTGDAWLSDVEWVHENAKRAKEEIGGVFHPPVGHPQWAAMAARPAPRAGPRAQEEAGGPAHPTRAALRLRTASVRRDQ